MTDKICIRVMISGRVQGVCFRMETKRVADSFNVSGWVKNNKDGTVEAVFEGEKKAVESVVRWCEKGPSLSKVSRVDMREEDYNGEFRGFDIIYR
ncbi:MAG: acylphosphatase [Proteobacteria bacterium]|nr:acylphosphatase [Pseudomonadota bacterium]